MRDLERPVPQPFVGRMGLAAADPLLRTDDVYIGQWYTRERDFVVISWAAPAADAFYGHGPGVDLIGDVQITRAFTSRGDDIVGYDDERRDLGGGATAFDRKVALAVPAPPTRRLPPPGPSGGHRTAVPPVPSDSSPRVRDRSGPADGPARRGPVVGSRPRQVATPDATVLRHKAALLRTLAAPRRTALRQVLATLQPRQHDLVKWDPAVPLVVQGHPGAGKTIVAVHRAAYLVHPERDGGPVDGQVLLLGPTDNYVKHTTRAVQDLVPEGGVIVRSLGEVFRKIIPELSTKSDVGDSQPETYQDFDRGLCTLVDSAAELVRRRGALEGTSTRTEAARIIYQELSAKAGFGPPDWVPYLRALPPWDVAVRSERLAPLVAYCGLASGKHRFESPGHVIVDEAQDVRPIEWRILRLLVRPDAGWTLVGDMNQRRSDHSSMSWQQSLEFLDLSADSHVEQYQSVFRSTTAIHRFAGQLLPRPERTGLTVQEEGSRPITWKVRSADLPTAVVTAGGKLARDHSGGTTAVISVEASSLRGAFASHGWRARAAGADEYSNGEVTVRVLAANDARGLEFDAVVVVEPSDFPKNLGRHGQLYTSLTRANRSLVVVHSKTLPDELRRAPAERLDQ
ncbi:UvrD-helicase domain-containing protein [Blastococcus sp. URHD0036]|uniref:UvrD-helicase domain-containing protein n=1 Tax=Blastococcus sp. URHD0036 TaxID=1380356 RepID=UPI0012DFD068|nr:UvrD-helicase domain-containing protein [Blastococcus sp. URHD0036]